jgi:TPR repeat protein
MLCGPPHLLDVDKAISLLHQAASPPEKKPNNSFENIIENNSLGNADAQNMLGELCEIGVQAEIEGSPNVHQALEWYRKAIKQGHARALFNIAALYERGRGVEKDVSKAIKFYLEVVKHLIIVGKTRI